MKKSCLSLLLLFLLGFCCHLQAHVKPRMDNSSGRAVSLKTLQNNLIQNKSKGAIQPELLHFAGLKTIQGCLFDTLNHDVILIGNLDDTLPDLHVEDFVIALRNSWNKYADIKKDVHYYAYPGCSIDPASDVMLKLDEIGNRFFMSNSKDTIQTGIQNWNSVCESPQTVSVFGIPYNTRFGSILVKADYDMKKLVDGSDSLDIPDFASLLDMKLNRLRTAIMAKEQPVVQISSTNRFWFYPGENHYLEDDGIVVIEKSQVTLLTEEQYVSGSGKMVGTGRPDPMAREFAQNFTTRYSEIAVNRPIYLELENLFRYVALAKIIYIRSGQTELGFDLSYFLDYFEIHFNPVASALPGRHNVKEFLHKQDFGDSTQIFQVWLPCCGGVAIEMNLSQKNFTLDKSGELLNLKQTVLEAKPMPNSLFWDYPIRGRDD